MRVQGPVRGVLIVATLVAVALVLLLLQPVRIFHWREFRTGDEIVSKVEAFRSSHGRLPESLKEVGIEDPDNLNVFYRKTDTDEYVVWFGTTLGESETFSSRSKKWQ